jgi:hypothetical protein
MHICGEMIIVIKLITMSILCVCEVRTLIGKSHVYLTALVTVVSTLYVRSPSLFSTCN